MKKIISVFLCVVIMISCFALNTNAVDSRLVGPVTNFSLTAPVNAAINDESAQPYATGLITMYALSISRSGTTLKISGTTYCVAAVVKCGFKNLTVERRLNSSSSWEDYYEYGNIYIDAASAVLNTSLTVEPGYQYRVTTKHYAKKNILMVQTISNESNIGQF